MLLGGRPQAAGCAVTLSEAVPSHPECRCELPAPSLRRVKMRNCRLLEGIPTFRAERVTRSPPPWLTSAAHIATVYSACSTVSRISSSHYSPCCFQTALGKNKTAEGVFAELEGLAPFLNAGVGGGGEREMLGFREAGIDFMEEDRAID